MNIRCPTCKERVEIADDAEHRPFCSTRCKTIDLGNWIDEVYRFSRPVADHDPRDDEMILE